MLDKDAIIAQVMDQLNKQAQAEAPAEATAACGDKGFCAMTEYVGVAPGDTIGLVVANLDYSIHDMLGFDKKYRSIGIVGARSGGGPQAMAADEAVKATNTELILFELPRDTQGGGGHGSLLIFGAEDVSDAKRAVEIVLKALETTYYGDTYFTPQGHLEFQYTARASHVLSRYFNAEEGKSWGMTVGCPAAIGMVMADAAVKSADVKVVKFATPTNGNNYTNETACMFIGDSGAVKQAVIAGREAGLKLLRAMGTEPKSSSTPYII